MIRNQGCMLELPKEHVKPFIYKPYPRLQIKMSLDRALVLALKKITQATLKKNYTGKRLFINASFQNSSSVYSLSGVSGRLRACPQEN